jgi:multidrug efflux pump
MTMIHGVAKRARVTLFTLCLVLIAGMYAYVSIPKEAEPDVNIPVVLVMLTHHGIQPEDATRLLIRPMEQKLRTVDGVKKLTSTAYLGGARLALEFNAGFDIDKALEDVREEVDKAKKDLPFDTEEPEIKEINFSQFPVLVVSLWGDVSERTLADLGDRLKDQIEGLPSVLEVNIKGKRTQQVEMIIDPVRLNSYNIDALEVVGILQQNNRLIAAGAVEVGDGRFNIKVPGLYKTVKDVMDTPIIADGDRVIRIGDVATVKRTFKDRENFARLNGKPSVSLEVSKRSGENIIQTTEMVRYLVDQVVKSWPPTVRVTYSQDKSNEIKDMLNDLQNNVISAVILVMIIVLAALGIRSSLLVGLSIPGSFLLSIFILYAMGYTMNIVVLFSLIMAVGMLVDGAIVVIEYAEQQMEQGVSHKQAYLNASGRMALPIIASTATTLAAFLPLLFWPGVVGEFMKYLPITLIVTLSSSLLMALVFVPVVGTVVPKRSKPMEKDKKPSGFITTYGQALSWSLRHPLSVIGMAFGSLVFIVWVFSWANHGVEFFPNVEPENAVVQVHARGNLSVKAQNDLVSQVEERILGLDYFTSLYTVAGRNIKGQMGQPMAEDVIGTINLSFKPWHSRPKVSEIIRVIDDRVKDLAGINVEVQKEKKGPPTGKPVQVQVRSYDPALLGPAVERIRAHLESMPNLHNVEDERPLPGIDFEIQVDKAQAAKFGASIGSVGEVVKLATNGIKLTEYRPDDSLDEIEIVARYPQIYRNLDEIDDLRLTTPMGLVPLSNFVKRVPKPQTGRMIREDFLQSMTVKADVKEGMLADPQIQAVKKWLSEQTFDDKLFFKFIGEDEEKEKAQGFLSKAFLVALFIMALILIGQFNSFYDCLLILSSVILSTIGVMVGLIVTGQAFGIVMNGVGIVALAGIVVNNNIILIDTFNELRQELNLFEALYQTGLQRLRPVFLTTVTTILGLIPMVFALNIDFVERTISQGAPSTQWWVQLSTAVAFGLGFATVLTLLVTPAALMLFGRLEAFVKARLMG